MHGKALLLALAILVGACSPAPASRLPSATPSGFPSATPSGLPSATPEESASPSATPAPSPTPVARTISGRVTMSAGGAPVAGVRIRAMPMALNDGRAPGAEVSAVTDSRGAYTFSVLTWTLEALAASSSVQLMMEVVPPPGLLVDEVAKSLGGPPGTAMDGPFLVGDLDGPIDITLEPGHIVEGTVTGGLTGSPLAGAGVVALGPNSILLSGGQGDAFEVQARAVTDTGGRFRLTVRPGTYAIHAGEAQGAQQRFWSDEPTVFQATLLSVERDRAGIDIALFAVTRIGGQLRPAQPSAEGPADVRVTAYRADLPCCRVVGRAVTGFGGNFLMYVPPGAYRIVFEPPAGSPYLSQWWKGAAGYATATDVTAGPDAVRLEVELANAGR